MTATPIDTLHPYRVALREVWVDEYARLSTDARIAINEDFRQMADTEGYPILTDAAREYQRRIFPWESIELCAHAAGGEMKGMR